MAFGQQWIKTFINIGRKTKLQVGIKATNKRFLWALVVLYKEEKIINFN